MATYTDPTVLRYAITNRAFHPGGEPQRQAALVQLATCWGAEGIEFIQLREKDLAPAALATLARSILQQLPAGTRLLINSRTDVAIAVRAHGVHLTASPDESTPAQVRQLFAAAGLPTPLISASCHSLAEVQRARDAQVAAILFSPVFGKSISGQIGAGQIVSAAQGLEPLAAACTLAAPVPVYALGGVTSENAAACLAAGAAGIAGIRLFHREPPLLPSRPCPSRP